MENEITELHCQTNYSQFDVLETLHELKSNAMRKGLNGIAVTDLCSVQAFSDAFGFLMFRKGFEDEDGFKVILGTELRMTDNVGFVGDRVVILAQNESGLKNLYHLITLTKTDYKDNDESIPKEIIDSFRDGLLIGSPAFCGEIYSYFLRGVKEENISDILDFYDYFEIEPVSNCLSYYDDKNEKYITAEDIRKANLRIVQMGEKLGKPVVATSEVHYASESADFYYGVLRGVDYHNRNLRHYMLTTDEMLDEFEYLGEDTARKVVIDNTNLIADRVEYIKKDYNIRTMPVIPEGNERLERICRERACELYGNNLPSIVEERLEKEIEGITGNGYTSVFLIAREIVEYNRSLGYPVGIRGGVGSSFAAYLLGISETNPLPPHYICRKCGFVDFSKKMYPGYHIGNVGADLPDMVCPECGEVLQKDGFDIPYDTFFMYSFGREPDIDLNVAEEMLKDSQRHIGEIEGVGGIYRFGYNMTLGGDRLQTLRLIDKYLEDNDLTSSNIVTDKIYGALSGVKCNDAVHPYGMLVIPEGTDIEEYTPICRSDIDDGIPVTHLDGYFLNDKFMKFDIINHNSFTMLKKLHDMTGFAPADIPLHDEHVLSLFSSPEAMGVTSDEIRSSVGILSNPEFGSPFVVSDILSIAKPKGFSDIIRILGLLHGTGTWFDNAERLIINGVAELSDCIACRDDVMLYLMDKGVSEKDAFSFMEYVRKGIARKKGWNEELQKIINDFNIAEWFTHACTDIGYLFPKSHAASYALMGWRLLYYKLYYPEAYYKVWLEYSAEVIDEELIRKGNEYISKRYDFIIDKIRKFEAYRSEDNHGAAYDLRKKLSEYSVALEINARGIEI